MEPRGRSPRAISKMSRNPALVMMPVTEPRRSRMALSPRVVPWVYTEASSREAPVARVAVITPSAGAAGVVGDFRTVIFPLCSS